MGKESFKFSGFVIAVLIKTVFSTKTDGQLHSRHYTDAHRALHRLVQQTTHPHLRDFDIVVPKISTPSSRTQFETHTESDKSLLLSVSSRDEDFDIEVLPAENQLISRDFFVGRISRTMDGDSTSSYQDIPLPSVRCHHIGRVISHGNGTAAISTCKGMTGLLRTNLDDILIEPVPSHLPHQFEASEKPHILYKRKHLSPNQQDINFCGKARTKPIPTTLNDLTSIREFSNGKIAPSPGERVSTGTEERTNTRERNRRSEPKRRRESSKRVVETLVVADASLVAKHSWMYLDVTQYILTVLNMASALYKDPALDVEIEFSVVGLILLEDDRSFNLDHRADVSLANFCEWQSRLNMTGRARPDHAILITGTDICIDKNEPCDTLGLAQIGGMCSRSGSCTLNEDTGLGVAFTIAHETGHSFGLKHDGQSNSCGTRDGHIMSSTLNTDTGVFSWSPCSRREMSNFLQSEQSECLENQPVANDFSMPSQLPGQIFNASQQCQLQYGSTADVCYEKYFYNSAPICKILFCYLEDDRVCRTKHVPAAEGTSCGQNKWCRRGTCVPLHSSGPRPVNGRWSNFTPWSECSRTCGNGISFKERSCSRPKPRYGGRYCDGEERVYKLCKTQDCPPNTPSYRAQQCAKFDSRPYRRKYYSWIPFTRYWKYSYNRCELFCEAKGRDFFDRLAPEVLDGTRCDQDTNDICIEGRCRHVGCDMKINSNATADACGVCNGDNSTCAFTNGNFRKKIHANGYFYVTKIPKGARTVRIWQERCCTHTYIAVKNPLNSSDYHLNGNWRVNLYGNKRFAGITWLYERTKIEGDTLYTLGPLKEAVIIEALVIRTNPGILFSYAMPTAASDNSSGSNLYSWSDNYSSCSKSCGIGLRRVVAKCVDRKDRAVEARYCAGIARPENRTIACNVEPCPARWLPGNWSSCSRSCGGGVQMRKIACVQRIGETYSVVPTRQCRTSKLKKHRKCTNEECPPDWKATSWSKCSSSCGRGYRLRTVYCKSGFRKIQEVNCDASNKPKPRQSCLLRYCKARFRWSVSRWGQCSVSCGTGTQRRQLKCTRKDRQTGTLRTVHRRLCKRTSRPRSLLHKRCGRPNCVATVPTDIAPTQTKPGPILKSGEKSRETSTGAGNVESSRRIVSSASWVSGAWQTCTQSCGGGRQVRAVRCMMNSRPSVTCSYSVKPPHTRECNSTPCAGAATRAGACVDNRSWCVNVFRRGNCNRPYLEEQCCKSCHSARRRGLL